MNIHRLPIAPSRSDFDSEEEYLDAVDRWDELYNEAEDLAMEDYYDRKFNN